MKNRIVPSEVPLQRRKIKKAEELEDNLKVELELNTGLGLSDGRLPDVEIL